MSKKVLPYYIAMAVETGFVVAGASLITVIITKLKCYVKKNGSLNWGCGFMDKPLVDDDELVVKQFDLGDNVKGLYVMPKGHNHLHHEEHEFESDND
jgi:hypothetical protein